MKQSHLVPWGVAQTIQGVALVARGLVDYKSAPTLAAGDVKLSKDGGAEANLGTLPSATGTNVAISLSASDNEVTRGVITFVDQTSPKEWEDEKVYYHTPLAEGALCGKITSGTPSTTSFISAQLTGANADQLKDAYVTFLTGTCAGATKLITAFNAGTDAITCNALPAAPAAGDVFIIANGA